LQSLNGGLADSSVLTAGVALLRHHTAGCHAHSCALQCRPCRRRVEGGEIPEEDLNTVIAEISRLPDQVNVVFGKGSKERAVPYSDDAADWKNEEKVSGMTSISLAMPINIMNKNIVIGASYNNRIDVLNYDRNETYLDPHPGYLEYDMPPLIESGMDPITINWSDFIRKRTGSISEFQTVIATELTKVVNLGVSMKYFSGETEDIQSLNKVGYFTLFDQNEFSFSYDTLNVMTKGKSTFNGMQTEVGLQLVYDDLGLEIPDFDIIAYCCGSYDII